MTETRSTELNEQLRQAEKQRIPKRQTPFSKAFVEFIPTDWAPYPDELPEPLSSAPSATAHRDALAARFDSDRLVIPAGHLCVATTTAITLSAPTPPSPTTRA